MVRAHGFHKGMKKNWAPKDKPRQDHAKTKTIFIMGTTGRMRKETKRV